MVQIITNSNGGGGGVGVYKYKGSVNSYEDLPTSGMKIGDTYNVINEHTTNPKFPAGANLAWTGTEWDVLGGTVDLSGYQKKLVEGEGIDINQTTNEISVDTTVIATKQDLTTKQDVISDLDTIRSGASKGATAIQPNDNVSELANDAGYLVSSDLKQSDWGQTDSSAIDYIKNKPTIGNATLTIQKNGTTVNTITMNATSNVTANIGVPTKVSDLSNDSGFITKDVNNLTNYTKTSDLGAAALSNSYTDLNNKPDLSVYQTTANLVTNLTDADDTHYPSAKAVSDAITASGGGDMLKSVYDPNNKNANAFDYNNFINTPTIPGVIDSLNSSSTTDALSANQGKVLKDAIDNIDLSTKQDKLTAGDNIQISGTSVISATDTVYSAGENINIEYPIESDMQGPCPSGFHVPLNTEWKAVRDIRVALGGGSSVNFGIALKLPFAGDRSYSSASAGSRGIEGNYWSSSRHSADFAYRLYFDLSALNPQSYNCRAYGYSVRCFKNSPTVPTSSWTKLYGTSIEAGGIFWSSTDGLISLSSDGNTWITIADKNLGATTVWNSGDTLSEANCGYYYQRGNNYSFPFTGGVTTSSTQVDASTYGPGNYYSSSTFITRSSSPYSWDTTDNGNLWGGVTQGTQPDYEHPIISADVNEVPSGGNNGDVLTNVNGTPTWQAPSGGDVMVSSQSGNILTSGMKIWAGTESDYTNLGTYDQNTIYLTI